MGSLYLFLLAGSSSNSSNNTSKETRSSGGGGGERSATGPLFIDDTSTIRPRPRSTTSTEVLEPAAAAAVSGDAEEAAVSPGGSVDDEWSRQLDELDRLRPGHQPLDDVVDSFTDLPDVVIDDVDDDVINDDAASASKQTAVDQVTSVYSTLQRSAVYCLVTLIHCSLYSVLYFSFVFGGLP